MKEAIIPFIGYCLLQLFVGVVGLNLVRDKEMGLSEALKSWVFGQMLLLAVLQVVAVPMILARWKFNALFWSYVIICVALFGFGCVRLRKISWKAPDWKKWNVFAVVLLVAVLVLIGFQFHKYLFMMHLDEDDARWLAEANDALEYGDMLTRNYDTGEYLGHIHVAKDGTSPWPMMYAIVSRILWTRPPVFTHTIYAPIELLLMYVVYWLIASELFEKIEARLTFLLSVCVINLFFGKTFYTQSVFSLVRIWQGKGTVAAVIVPLLSYLFIRMYRHDELTNWLLVPITCCAACLMSGMGISLSAISVSILGICHIVLNKKWKRVPMLALSVFPSSVFLLIYTMFRTL